MTKMTKREFENMMLTVLEEHPEQLQNEEIFDAITDEYWNLYGSDDTFATKEYPTSTYVCLAQEGKRAHQMQCLMGSFFCRNRL